MLGDTRSSVYGIESGVGRLNSSFLMMQAFFEGAPSGYKVVRMWGRLFSRLLGIGGRPQPGAGWKACPTCVSKLKSDFLRSQPGGQIHVG